MTIDPQLVDVLPAIPEQCTWDPLALRAAGDRAFAVRPPDGIRVVDTGSGPLRLHGGGSAPAVVVLAVHGGGYVAGRAAFDDVRNAELAALVPGALIASPEYRLAPEHPYPAAVEDCLAALHHLAAEYPHAPLVLLGDSAGGGLVDQMGGMLAAGGDGELAGRVRGVVLLEPCLDPACDTASYATWADGPVWTRRAARAAWEHYLGPAAAHVELPRWTRGAPPHLIVANPLDPLRDEAVRRACELTDAGVSVELFLPAGSVHGCLSVPGTRVWAQVRGHLLDFLARVA